jgi:prepilin-type N-terminal cleavage/methylation domain-containing protein
LKSAITLIELLVVIALVGIIAGVGWPALTGQNFKVSLRNDYERINSFLEEAKAEAINRGITVQVTTTANNDGWVFRAQQMPSRVCTSPAVGAVSLAIQIPDISIDSRRDPTILLLPGAYCFRPDGSALRGGQGTQDYMLRRNCGDDVPFFISYRTGIFAATGLLNKEMRLGTAPNPFEDL